ncbi:hypothetical protein [Mucilaginibacter lacusdianchii]|uniref:hypothetical protein n=1 Tax=Mucilaginibacter lacusdianchii TaxID=2684211 RepID=UPI00131CCD72|nr:hypothetical protein [Mucilaginibacter sp. JXJ CY 39]
MKKQRGLKRYYQNLERHIGFDKISWLKFDNPDTWSDNWHWHFDPKGYGNTSFKKRKPHLDKLFRYFKLISNEAKSLKLDFQLYAIILDFNSSSDALFLHKPNPNNSQFTFKIESLTTQTTFTNQALNAYIEKLNGYEKLYGRVGQAFCLLYRKGVGKPF